ncbi:hypothetical protein ACFC26_07935 [Kitasatospora purpeofusca]|uniref:hypothetical protein n=1 Tax=Kitasatospora purpeofusca TaxID=67352 RepID=UPI0035D72E9F
MSILADAVQRAAERAVREFGSSWILATVTDVGTSVVTIATATGPVADVRRLASYSPTVGDTVMVTRNESGTWLVVGSLA